MTIDIRQSDWIYDIETYLDLFCAGFTHITTGTRYIFEVSERRDDSTAFVQFLYNLRDADHRLFGYNNLHFDWPVCDHLIKLFNSVGHFKAIDAHDKANAIIRSINNFEHSVKPREIIVPQGDLFKIHHFDNRARSTSLKKLEINMRSASVIDLPYPPDKPTTSQQKDEIIAYMCHDINETMRFYLYSVEKISFRDELAQKHSKLSGALNFNDTKIGKQFFIMQLEANGTQCYHARTGYGGKEPIQTIRSRINIGDILSPKLQFQHAEFKRVHDWLSHQSMSPDQTKGFLSGDDALSATIDNFTYDFGTGGIHGSISKEAVHEDDDFEIWDWDVASYYPNIAITHGLYPEHLSSKFCEIYLDMFNTRKEYPKGTAENAMYKLALNGVYGDSNNVYSPFYDPQYTMSVTINGQLLLCMLAEWLTHYADQDGQLVSLADYVRMVQINTDGLTIKVHKSYIDRMNEVCKVWEQHTGLELESVRYKSMFIRDVNNYIAVKTDGSVKRKGAYSQEIPIQNRFTGELQWHQNHSMLVAPKAAEAFMVHGTPIEEFIMNHRDPWDFQLSVKVPRSAKLQTTDNTGLRSDIQNTTRYYISTGGVQLTKVMQPLASKLKANGMSVGSYNALRDRAEQDAAQGLDAVTSANIAAWHERREKFERRINVNSGWTVTVTNDINNFNWSNVNWLFYIEEARKLLIGVGNA